MGDAQRTPDHIVMGRTVTDDGEDLTPQEHFDEDDANSNTDLLSTSMYSHYWKDENGKALRVKGVMSKRGGSRRSSGTFKVLAGLGTGWNERHFFLNVARGVLRYYSDKELSKPAGVVHLLPFKSYARVLPGGTGSKEYYAFEIMLTADDHGKEREGGFVVRAPSAVIRDEWLRSLKVSIRQLGDRAAAGDGLEERPTPSRAQSEGPARQRAAPPVAKRQAQTPAARLGAAAFGWGKRAPGAPPPSGGLEPEPPALSELKLSASGSITLPPPPPANSPRRRPDAGEERVDAKAFEPIRVVGRGASGAVLLVKKKYGAHKGEFYAMKVMSKRAIADAKMEKSALVEREVLLRVRHPFLVNLRYSFQSRTKLYLVTDFYGGGSLEGVLKQEGALSVDAARFAAGELTLAVGHLQSRRVLHRDIKAANVLLDGAGHYYLADYGLARLGSDDSGKKRSFAGTLEYMAPETISKGGGATSAIDWWALGILLFEMVSGRTPFAAAKPRAIFENILRMEPPVGGLERPLQDAVLGLLRKDPAARLSKLDDVKALPFFADLDFDQLEAKALDPPFVPDDESGRSARVSEVVRACETAFIDREQSIDRNLTKRDELLRDFSYSQEADKATKPPKPPGGDYDV